MFTSDNVQLKGRSLTVASISRKGKTHREVIRVYRSYILSMHTRTAIALIICEHFFDGAGAVQVPRSVRRDDADHELHDEERDGAASRAGTAEACRVGGESTTEMIWAGLRNDGNRNIRK